MARAPQAHGDENRVSGAKKTILPPVVMNCFAAAAGAACAALCRSLQRGERTGQSVPRHSRGVGIFRSMTMLLPPPSQRRG